MAGLVYVFPRAALDGFSAIKRGDVEHATNRGDTHSALPVKSAHFLNLFFRQFGLAVHTAFMVYAPTLANHISVVVGLCSKKQMINANAWRVIATMKDTESFGDRANEQFIGRTMRVRSWASSIKTKMSVTVIIEDAFPNPTRVGLLNPIQKPFPWWLALFQTSLAAKRTPRSEAVFSGSISRKLLRWFSAIALRTSLLYSLLSHVVHPPVMNKVVRLERCLRTVSSRFILTDLLAPLEV